MLLPGYTECDAQAFCAVRETIATRFPRISRALSHSSSTMAAHATVLPSATALFALIRARNAIIASDAASQRCAAR